jgi:hypothetical protein
LTTPLSLIRTPAEIDAGLAQQLKAFVDSHVALQQSVDEAKQQIAEAVKAIEDGDKARSKAKTTTLLLHGFRFADHTPQASKSVDASFSGLPSTAWRLATKNLPRYLFRFEFPINTNEGCRVSTTGSHPGLAAARADRSRALPEYGQL